MNNFNDFEFSHFNVFGQNGKYHLIAAYKNTINPKPFDNDIHIIKTFTCLDKATDALKALNLAIA